MFSDAQLPIIFASLMAFAIIVYALLDGYDLGVGMLLPTNSETESDTMIASIGPFWDANETWLVLAVGLLLIAFPVAHSLVLGALYIPVSIMLIGLIIRGVAFDFRAKVKSHNKRLWDRLFKFGSALTAFMQGFMLGLYVMQFEYTIYSVAFSLISGLGVCVAYTLIGAAWLIMKTDGELQQKATVWAKRAGRLTFISILVVCSVNPIINNKVMTVWFTFPQAIFLLNLPLLCFCLIGINDWLLTLAIRKQFKTAWVPFALVVCVFVGCYLGLLISFYPDVVPGKLSIFDSITDPSSLRFLLYGSLIVIPAILMYTVFSYRIFWGKVEPLTYY